MELPYRQQSSGAKNLSFGTVGYTLEQKRDVLMRVLV
jgi:hypothetical protein